MKILLLGSRGQVGEAFQDLSKSEYFPIGWELIAWSREKADLSKIDALILQIKVVSPDVILNAAAYTAVDQAESEAEQCDLINAKAPERLAQYAKENQIPLVHFSSDYVYEGSGTGPHLETDALVPLGQYARSKAKGDQAIQSSGCDYLIFRTSWVFSTVGKNFVKTMLTLAKTRTELKVVNDQTGSPTYAPDLAQISLEVLMRALEKVQAGQAFPSGVYHVCNTGFTNWADFARTILPQTRIIGIPTSEYPTAAKRPLNSRLSLEKLKHHFGIEPRSWQLSLNECLTKLRSNA